MLVTKSITAPPPKKKKKKQCYAGKAKLNCGLNLAYGLSLQPLV